ncbi:hypothetical protein BC829DRAFT_492389 [Chytridium lagenaria]|nr:hypothetical protein BC829DRAFT_492389 [Chytridium lagenaria]
MGLHCNVWIIMTRPSFTLLFLTIISTLFILLPTSITSVSAYRDSTWTQLCQDGIQTSMNAVTNHTTVKTVNTDIPKKYGHYNPYHQDDLDEAQSSLDPLDAASTAEEYPDEATIAHRHET